MLTYPKSTLGVLRMLMHLSSGYVTATLGILPPWIFSSNWKYGAGWTHVGLCPKFLVLSCSDVSHSIVIEVLLWSVCHFSSVMMANSIMGAECQLLKPVCLRVAVARNLSASWYHASADIELTGRLQEISVNIFICCYLVGKEVN